MTSNTTNLGASSPLPEGGKSLRIPLKPIAPEYRVYGLARTLGLNHTTSTHMGPVIGSVIGVLIAGVLAKLFPELDLLYLQAGIVAAGCFLGLLLDGLPPFKKRKD